MMLGGRDLRTVLGAALQPRHYYALGRMFRTYDRPLGLLARYLLKRGRYPTQVEVETPTGTRGVQLRSHHDLLSLNEIFCREDYRVGRELRYVVDLGSNIGLSALYFLTRNQESFTFLYEPVPANVERLRDTLRGFEARYRLEPVCVGTHSGTVEFGVEDTGRYGGIGVPTGRVVSLPCRDINAILDEVFAATSGAEVDLLKVDIEGMEAAVVRAIRPEHLARIRLIYAETDGSAIRLDGFLQRQRHMISTWTRAGAATSG